MRFQNLFRFPESPALASRWFRQLAAIDLALVAVFLILRLMQGIDLVPRVPPLLDIFSDTGLPERFNHVKWAAISVLLLLTFLRLRVPLLLSMSALFALILADDALRLHEMGSDRLALLWPDMPTLGMTRGEAGEIAVWLALGLVTVPMIAWGVLTTPRMWWSRLRWPLVGFAGIVFFAIGMDVAQQPLWFVENQAVFYWGKMILGLIEDTGESIFGSLTVGYAVAIWHFYGHAPAGAPAE